MVASHALAHQRVVRDCTAFIQPKSRIDQPLIRFNKQIGVHQPAVAQFSQFQPRIIIESERSSVFPRECLQEALTSMVCNGETSVVSPNESACWLFSIHVFRRASALGRGKGPQDQADTNAQSAPLPQKSCHDTTTGQQQLQ